MSERIPEEISSDSDREESDEENSNEKNYGEENLIEESWVQYAFQVILSHSCNIHITYIIYITCMVKLIFKAYKKNL